ncbi:UV-endonuclease UvdE [Ascobolus immersus RN42]|uniref:UV-endonuclease UvdE n=1 Tax=Ascobolus immersus RN42 TaxID=1160509 RepID=A0A3N4IKY3_ASCIM|nr:UV-endonuclease UvdE [Ascobolus immersus RN42]
MEEEIALLDKELEEMDRAWEADVKGELFPDKEAMTTAFNSTDDPLPYTGRLGYACLNTHLRNADPPVFCSRTCRLATLNAADSSLEHAQQLGLQNAWDLVKLIEWNEAHNIKFMRISSEMFPFASHPDHVYDLNFAAEPLAKAGELAAKWGHRLTTHPGQFTQLASPRKEVIRAAIADLKYHNEMLTMLKLPPELDKDAVIILHMGGVFGDKPATISRFKETWPTLPAEVRRRIVLENDDVSYSVHDILPVCQELDIPLVLDWHHHNIIHDDSIREGTLDVLPLLPAIAETWKKRGIKQKMHYSEPVPGARGRDRRKHSEIVRFLPPGLGDVDLMVEAKGKERAVWGLMRRYGLGGWERKKGPDVVPVVIGVGKPPEEKKSPKIKKKKVVKEVVEDGKVVKEEVVEEVVETAIVDGQVVEEKALEDSEESEAALLDKELDEMEEDD